jgi:FkbM family methyltransferase
MKRAILSLGSLSARLLPQPIKRAVYGWPPLARVLRRALNRAAPDGLTLTRVAAGELAGMSLYLNLQTEKDYWLGTYEPELQAAARHFVKSDMVVYDVGANIGYISLLFADCVGPQGQVFSFEALPANQVRLEQNVAANHLSERVVCVAAAVTDQQSTVRFLVHESTSMGKVDGSPGRQEEYQHSIEVPGIALDDFIFEEEHPAPQLIKMDIEGGEVMAVRGMQRLLREIQPVLLIELHGPEAARAVGSSLLDAGYLLRDMKPGFPILANPEDFDWKAYIIATPGIVENLGEE